MLLLIDLIVIILVVVVFTKASRNKRSSSILWAFVGVIFYFLGKAIFALIIFGVYSNSIDGDIPHSIQFDLLTISELGGTFIGMFTAYFLGEMCGLNIKRIVKGEKLYVTYSGN